MKNFTNYKSQLKDKKELYQGIKINIVVRKSIYENIHIFILLIVNINTFVKSRNNSTRISISGNRPKEVKEDSKTRNVKFTEIYEI